MPRRLNIEPDFRGEWSGDLNLAEWVSSTSYDEVAIRAHPYDYVSIQLVGATALTWGSASIDVRRSLDGANAVEYGTPVSLTAVGISGKHEVQSIGWIHLAVDSSATPTTGSGTVRAHIKFHRT